MATDLQVELNAAIVAVENLTPMILVVPSGSTNPVDGLPFGPFDPLAHRTMEIGLRSWVEEQTSLSLGYVEQLYTFGDRGRHARAGDTGPHIMSVGYLALARPAGDTGEVLERSGARWRDWYTYFPWEDWRQGEPPLIEQVIRPKLDQWCRGDPGGKRKPQQIDRVRLAFGQGGAPWDEERVLDRYELLYEAGLVEESRRDGRENSDRWKPFPKLGVHMRYDHRRILATAISRLRAKLKYRPVVFELMPETFTLTQLQHTVEAISGRHLHKQNFRRLVEQGRLVEPAGGVSLSTGGRPAALYRFRRDVMGERPAPGLRVGGRF